MEHSVAYNSTDDDCQDRIPQDVTIQSGLPNCNRAFTIDPSNARNLDDALSIVSQGIDRNGCEVYQIGVHITNAAKHIAVGSAEDIAAKELGISVYGDKDGGKMMHMLQNRSTRQALSLFPGRLRDVLSVTCNVTMPDTPGLWDMNIESSNINPTQLRSAFKLSYEDAQNLLRNIIPEEHVDMAKRFDEDNENPSLCESMKLLYSIAMVMRHNRLKSDSAFVYDIDDPGEGKNLQAHLLVSEFMIWANNEVAKKLYSEYPNASILCKQEPPLEEKMSSIIEEHMNSVPYSLNLSRYLRETGHEDMKAAGTGIILPYDLLNRALRESDHIFLAHLLSTDKLYPQLAAVTSKFLSISKRSEYCCTEEDETNPSAYRHYSLCLDQYTHFTSPIRRYVDIVMQRMLLQQSILSREELEELCIAFNSFKRNASSYEKAIKRVRFASNLLSNSEVCTAYVSQQNPTSVELTFHDPDLKFKDLPVTAKILETNRCFPHAKDSDIYTWKLRVTSLSKDYAAELLQIPSYSVSRHVTTTKCSANAHLLKALCSYDDTTLDIQQFLAIPHKPGEVVSPDSWLKIQGFIKQPTKEKAIEVKEILKRLPSKHPSTSPKLNTSNTSYFFLDCDVKLPLKESDPVKLWLSWSTKEPVITPAIQLLEVSPLLRICVQHNTHPADCFSDPDLQHASLKVYPSLECYTELWKKVLLAEAAVKSVHECQPIVIQGVYLEWPKLKTPDDCIEVQYHIPTSSIKMVLPADFVQNCSEYFRIRIGDLICARYGCDYLHKDERLRAVYHLVVHDIQKPKGTKQKSVPEEIVIFLEPVGKVNCHVSNDIKNKLESKAEKYLCEIQIVPMSISYR